MCRLFALTSNEPQSPMVAIEALNVMKEGHDGSGMGLLLRDLSGPFNDLKDYPILSGIFTEKGLQRLDNYMLDIGFVSKYILDSRLRGNDGSRGNDGVHTINVYEYPKTWHDLDDNEKLARLLLIRLELRAMGEKDKDMIVFSFWPDTIMIKETGDPLTIAHELNLTREEFQAKIIMVQGRQNTNYDIDLYACHPFFLQGFATMTNGENTAFTPIREFLKSRGFPGYSGYQSDSEVFTHILHYTMTKLKLDLPTYKHIITPLPDTDIAQHKDAVLLKNLKQTCRNLIIDGPNCVIGLLPDNTVFMLQDKKKLRPGVVGGRPGLYAFCSEPCGLDAAIPKRDKTQDFQPMHLDTVIVGPDKQEVKICQQS
jgi:predicted glutamine amidotransferase